MMPSLKRKRDDICELLPAKRPKLEDPLIVFDSFQDMASHIPFPPSSQKEGAVDIFFSDIDGVFLSESGIKETARLINNDA